MILANLPKMLSRAADLLTPPHLGKGTGLITEGARVLS